VRDLDVQVLGQLQRHHGRSFAHRLEVMVKDMDNAEDLQRDFREYQGRVAADTLRVPDFGAVVLTASQWPTYTTDTLVPPPSLERGMRSFENFYGSSYPGRKLRWIQLLGSGAVSLGFRGGAKEVEGNVVQASVLLAIGDAPGQRLSLGAIASRLNVPVKGMRASIAPMYLRTNLLVLCDASGAACAPNPEMRDSDVLGLNRGFVHKQRKLRLGQPSSAAALEGGQEDVLAARRHVTDAAIVRTMKSRRTLGHKELCEEVLRIISKTFFTPANPAQFIKERVGDLISREFMKRADGDGSTYVYVA
jgi:hypothetical protein